MKTKVACLVVAILATIGCSPSNPPQQASTGNEPSNEHSDNAEQNTQVASLDPPNCDSEETRKIVQEIVLTKHPLGSAGLQEDYSSHKICLQSNESSIKAEDRNSVFSENCESIIDEAIKDQKNPWLKDYLDLKQNLVVFNDATFSFHSYVVKNENRAADGNSNFCSLMFVKKISSQSANFSFVADHTDNIKLTLYKLDQNGDRPYEYKF